MQSAGVLRSRNVERIPLATSQTDNQKDTNNPVTETQLTSHSAETTAGNLLPSGEENMKHITRPVNHEPKLKSEAGKTVKMADNVTVIGERITEETLKDGEPESVSSLAVEQDFRPRARQRSQKSVKLEKTDECKTQ